MAIYRGPGGAGDATGDATNASALALAARDEAQASASSAASSATAAANSATAADTSEASAATSASNAAGSATTASTAATNASSSATAASSSAATATTKASQASTSATAAASSASAASTSASNASTSATNAASSASTASTQASNASTSASSAATSATNAASSATAAASSATDAAASAASINDASLVHKATDETITGTKTFTANQIISVTDNTDAALRITQLGTGNALLVEDSTNPDSTPFVIDANGRVGIGTTAPLTNLHLSADGFSGIISTRYTTGSAGNSLQFQKAYGTTASPAIVASGSIAGRLLFSSYDGSAFLEQAEIRSEVDGTPGTNDMPGRLVFSTTADGASSPTERMRINSSGNVGIGTSSPVTKLNISGAGPVTFRINDTNTNNWDITNNSYLSFTRGSTEAMRIDSSGNLLVGQLSVGLQSQGISLAGSVSNSYAHINHANGTASGQSYLNFGYNTTTIGSIAQNGTTAVAYNTSSDYRLKENVQPMTGALSVVSQLKPCTYTWKSDGSDGQGFIAHELQEVVPDCVTGEKDAVDAEGNPVYQGIDTSFLVATLTAAIQEQQAIIEQLRADVEALKGQA